MCSSYKNHFGPKPAERVEMAPARPLLDRLSKIGTSVLENAERELEERRLVGDDREAETAHDIAVTMRALQASVCLGLRGESEDLYGFLALTRRPASRRLLAGRGAAARRLGQPGRRSPIENSQVYQQMKERDRLAALGEMAAGLAHEIRNPLGSIKASAQYLTETSAPPEDGAEFLDIIVDEVDRLNRVVSSFLDYARPAHSDPEPIHVNAAVRAHASVSAPRMRLGRRRPARHDGAGLPAGPHRHRAPPAGPHQPRPERGAGHDGAAATSSSKRAIKTASASAVPRGAGYRSASETPARESHPASSPILFVPFVTTKQQGTGLGLAISQRIISEAGGRIEVRSREGFGTTFVILLPAEGEAALDRFEAERNPSIPRRASRRGAHLEPVEP